MHVYEVILINSYCKYFFFFQAEDGIRYLTVTGVQTCALPIWVGPHLPHERAHADGRKAHRPGHDGHQHARWRSEEHTSELQSQSNLVCRLLLEKKKKNHLNQAKLGATSVKQPAEVTRMTSATC